MGNLEDCLPATVGFHHTVPAWVWGHSFPKVLVANRIGYLEDCRILAPDLSRIALYMASPPYKGLFRWRGRFRLGRVDPLEEGRRLRRVWPNRSMWTPHHALWWGSAA
ncbi:hypothetical protein M9H77_30839 [Catharanthus roseus]|uniref:Uncharacterized protein n=1 Tax=Catharanthus roseus TaxID=4058 RepID=A0ACB9ZYE1_CATRO|nr:hypothetical protein M9H77_30839 [Catharanthus roseus]